MGATVSEPSSGPTWQEIGLAGDTSQFAWQNTNYAPGAIVYPNGHFYVATQAMPAATNAEQPVFPIPPIVPRPTWQDSGTVAPASVASGQPSDQTLTLLNMTLPQSHTISTYNLAAGVVYSSIRSYTFGVVNSSTVQTGRSHTVDPLLFLTAYWLQHWFPMDAERDWRPSDLVPGFSFGLSLSSPSTNYYVGLSSEFLLRNVQLTGGLSIAKESRAAPGLTMGTSPNTVQRFSEGWFVGLTFNISGFIQGLVGSAKSGS
jgi:hypothetical protein